MTSEMQSTGLTVDFTEVTDAAAAHRAVAQILSVYPRQKPEDPKHYAAAMVICLTGLPVEWVRRISHPVTGVAGRCKWLPTIADLNEMLSEFREEERMARDAWNQGKTHETQVREMAERRAEGDVERSEADKRAVREMVEGMKQEFAAKNAGVW